IVRHPRVVAAAIRWALDALHQPSVLEPRDQPRHARSRDERLLGQPDQPHLPLWNAAQQEQDLEFAEAQPVPADELGVELARDRRVAPQVAPPDIELLTVWFENLLIGQLLTGQHLSTI